MNRRAFVTSGLLSAGFLAIAAGAAHALTGVAPPDHARQTGDQDVEKAWWRRHWGWRRRWRWRRRW
ncbi:conserved exported hypothetical protein [Methylocella tundrae]|uniref:Protamine-2 (Modular protein) n=1 Tax=Methylocella tundrae TaxID=227605 RepID=A0A4U8Z5K8_METTU|nr:hypothetical protein [Methylocella tundrae]WPP04433.1 hypothetical protein SIN04_18670 [Methylocella tundrae]VFU10804.1 conserved exported protein of unknown function [Methylocella tundrae]VTZ50774.1 conserved exported hypothetical protein [Methylocella tundrae]